MNVVVLTSFMPGKIWIPVLQNLNCGLRSPGYGASGEHVLLPGCSSQPRGSSAEPGVRIKAASDVLWYGYICRLGSAVSSGLHADSPSSGSKWGMWCLCEKHRINLFSIEAFFLFLFSSWDLKNKTREGNTEEFLHIIPLNSGISD